MKTGRPPAHHRRGISNPPVSQVMRESKIKNSEITTKDYRIPPGSLLLICRKLSIFVEIKGKHRIYPYAILILSNM